MRVLKKTIWPHQIKLNAKKEYDGNESDSRIQWLKERMPQDKWYVIAPDRFAFKTQEDAVMFSLRWG